MIRNYTIDEMLSHMENLRQTFNYVRLVEPYKCKVCILSRDANGDGIIEQADCFDIWYRERRCEKCTSLHCAKTGENVIKLESSGGESFCVISRSVSVNGCPLVLEMVCSISDRIVTDIDYDEAYSSIINKQKELINRDSLTSCHNRRYIDEVIIPKTDYNAARHDNVCLAMFDIDDFKTLNDRYGHIVGDKVLTSVGKYWRKFFESSNTCDVARYGGDEFIIVSYNTGLKEFRERILQLYNLFRKSEILDTGEAVLFSLSFGCASIGESEHRAFGELLEIADKRMYEAKTTGKNKVI